jgi:hypothetical protein
VNLSWMVGENRMARTATTTTARASALVLVIALGMVVLIAPAFTAAAATASMQEKPAAPGKPAGDKNAKPSGSSRNVDSGTFGVFIKGQRVVSEIFSIEQQNGNSAVKAQLKETDSPTQVAQKSDLEITGGGELLRYEWSNAAGSSLTVSPNNEFLSEKITPAGAKTAEQAFLMPNTSMILDNNFFVQREILTWRYMAADCHQESGGMKCKSPEEFGALVPQDRSSMRVRIELVGKEKVAVGGVERELLRLNLSGEGFSWALWLDDHDQYKLMRISIPADDTEVVRD